MAASTGSPASAPGRTCSTSSSPACAPSCKRNPNYHKAASPISTRSSSSRIADVAARTNALTTGEVHWIGRCDLKTLDLLKRNPNVDDQRGHRATATTCSPMNVTGRPSTMSTCALALKYAIDREDIVEKVFLGHATPGNDNPIAPSVKYRDRSGAAARLRPGEGEVPPQEGRPVERSRSTSRSPMPPSPAPSMPASSSRSMPRRRHRHQRHPRAERRLLGQRLAEEAACAPRTGAAGRPCDWMFTIAYAAGAAWNETFWNNPRFNELLVAGPRRDRRDEARGDVCRDAAAGPRRRRRHRAGLQQPTSSAHSKKLAHGEIAPNWEDDGMKIAERWWFA